MRIHIIGIATTFMTGLAVLARQAGHEISGSDSCFDLPTRTQLTQIGIELKEGFSPANLEGKPELIIIGNELDISNSELVAARRLAIPYISGSLWLEEYILHDKWAKNLPPHYDDHPQEKGDKSHAPPRPSDKPIVTHNAPKIPLESVVTHHAPKIPLDPNSKLKRTNH